MENQLTVVSLSPAQIEETFITIARKVARDENERLFELIDTRLTAMMSNYTIHDDDVILNAKESSEFLGIALPTFYEYTSQQRIPFFKKLKKIQCRKSDLKQWIESGRKKTRAEIDKEASNYLKQKGGAKK